MKAAAVPPRSRWRRTSVAATVLILVGAAVFGLRALVGTPAASPGDSRWHIVVVADSDALPRKTMMRIAPPFDTEHAQLVSQSVVLSGLRLRRLPTTLADRNLVLVADDSKRHRARIVFEISLRALRWQQGERSVRTLPTKRRERYLSPEADIQSDAARVQQLARTLESTRPATLPLAEHVVAQVADRIALTRDGAVTDDAVTALRTRRSSTAGRARAAVAVLRASRIPARLVGGVVLDEARSRQPHAWLEAFHDGRWHGYDPEYGYAAQLPPSYVPMNRTGALIAWTRTDDPVNTLLLVERQVIALEHLPEGSKSWLAVFDFAALPQIARETVGLLLLLPLGALVTVFVRLILGVRTYGIFSPVLLALAALFVDFSTALVIVAVVAALGFLGLAALPRSLSRTPRLAVVFTLVGLSMGIGVAVLLHLGRSAESVMVLLPVVVLTGLVDSFYEASEKSGLKAALARLAWTAAAAGVCFVILARDDLGQLLVHHPELHLVTMGLMIAMGAYRSHKPAQQKVQLPQSPQRNVT